MALRFASVMRGISKPYVVDLISSSEDAFGVVVPIPTAPFAGNVFCALTAVLSRTVMQNGSSKTFFIKNYFTKNILSLSS